MTNPYDPDTAPEPEFTREGVVTFSKFVTKEFGEGENAWTKNAWEIRYIQEGREKEQFCSLSTGKKAAASADGETLVDPATGKETRPYKTTAFMKAMDLLKESGFDISSLYPKISSFVGSKVEFVGVPRRDKDGNVKQHEYNGQMYTDYDFYPCRVLESGGAAPQPADDELTKKAEKVVRELLKEDAELTRTQLLAKVAAKYPSDIQLQGFVLNPDNLTSDYWEFDGTTLKAIPF
jgi:hypothetical protein